MLGGTAERLVGIPVDALPKRLDLVEQVECLGLTVRLFSDAGSHAVVLDVLASRRA